MTLSIKKKTLRKVVSSLTMLATVVSMSGIMALSSVSIASAAVVDGSLIKSNATNSDGSPTLASLDVYIVKLAGTKKFKRLILNPTVFTSYGHLNWGDIQTVSQAVMDEYTTSSLVRVDTDPAEKVYAMAPDGDIGSKSWVNLTSAQFLGVTGSDADAIYTINAVDGGNYTAVADVTTVAQLTTFYTTGVLPGVAPVPAGTGLTVALSAETPASTSIIADSSTTPTTAGAQAMVPMIKVNFTAAADGDVTVSTLKFKRSGIPSADVDFSAFYLYDGSNLVAEYSSISSGILTFTKSAGLFTVSAGTTKTMTLKMDVAEDLVASRVSKWSIVDATYVDAGSAVVSGSFPIDGNQMSSAVVADLGNITIASSSDSTTVNAGEINFEMWRFSLAAEGQNMEISRMKFTNIGTVDNIDDIKNIKLKKNDGTQYGDTKATFESDGTVTFDLSANPITVLKGNTDYYSVRGDIIGGTNRTFRLSVQQMYNIVAKDKEYGVYTKVNLADSWTVIQASQATTVNTGTMTVSRNTASPSGNVPLSGLTVEVARIDFAAVGENVKISSLPIKVARTAGSSVGLYAVKAYVDGSQIGSTTHLTADNTAQTFSFGNNFIVPAGETKTLVLKADIKEGDGTVMTALDSFTVTVNAGTATGTVSLATVTLTAQAGHLLTVSANALSTAKNVSMAEGSAAIPNGVAGSAGVKVGSAVITAGAGEAVDVTSIAIKEDTTGTDTAFTNLQNLKLKKADGTQIGTTQASLTADSTYTFTPSSAIRLSASQSMVVNIFADVKSGVSAGSLGELSVSLVNGIGVTTGTSANDSTGAILQVIYIIANGSLTTTIDGATPSSAQLVEGSADNHIATFRVEETTGAENITLTKIIVKNTTGADNTLINWAIYDGETGAQIGTTVPVSASGVVTFNSISWTIPAGATKTLKVKVGVSDYSAAVENTANYAYLASGNSAAFEGTGSGSGTVTITVGASNINANTMKTYRTILTAAGKTTSNAGGSYGATQEIAKIGLTSSLAYNAKFAASTTVDDETDSFTGSGLTTSTSTTKIDGTYSIEITEDAASAVTDYAYLTTAVTAGVLDDYSKVSFWVRSSSDKAAAGDLTFNIDNATDMTAATDFEGSIPALTAGVWRRVEFTLSGLGSTSQYVGIHIAASPDNGAVILVDDIRFYNDSLNLDISGNLGAVATSQGLAVYLKDASGTTKMTGYVYPTSTSAATVLFIPGTSDISIGNTEQVYTITTNTTTLMATDDTSDQSLNVNIDLGDASTAGDISWYDGAITATSPITWVSGSGPLTWSFSY